MLADLPPLPPEPTIFEVLTVADGNSGDELGRSVAIRGPLIVGGRWLADPDGQTNAGAARIWRMDPDGTIVAEGEVVAPDAAPHDELGVSVAVAVAGTDECAFGDPNDPTTWPRMIAGAWRADLPNRTDAGAAYVFRRDPSDATWHFEAKLTASDAATGSEFGRSVTIHGDRAVVGAWKHQGSRGALYVYRRDGTSWTEEAKLLATGGTFGDGLGVATAFDGARIVSGAWARNVGANVNQGAAYVFRRTDAGAWIQEAMLVASDGAASDEFGRGVAIDDDTIVVGTWPFWTDGAGAAYVFGRRGTAWSQQAKLVHPDPAPADYFGFSVGVSRDDAGAVAIVGAWADNVGANNNQGTAHVFRRDDGAWTHWTELVREDGQPSAYFGFSVAIDRAVAVVGSRLENVGANTNQGSVTVVCIEVSTCSNCDSPPIVGDINGDGVVDAADLGLLLGDWGGSGPADLDGNGIIDAADLGILLGAWTG